MCNGSYVSLRGMGTVHCRGLLATNIAWLLATVFGGHCFRDPVLQYCFTMNGHYSYGRAVSVEQGSRILFVWECEVVFPRQAF